MQENEQLMNIRFRGLGWKLWAGVLRLPRPAEEWKCEAEILGAGRERFGVGDDVFIAGILHAAADEGVGGGFDEIFGDVAGEPVPTVPSHGRSESQTVFQGGGGWSAKKKSGEKQKRQTIYYFFRKTLHATLPDISHFVFFSEPTDKTSHARLEREAAPDERKNQGSR
jgi:hypothetical protein